MTAPSQSAIRKIATNRKAFRDYSVLERVEAGIELRGTEVKSLRDGSGNLTGGYATVDGSQVTLFDINIPPYAYGNQFNHEPTRPRRLLLHKREIHKLLGLTSQKGYTLIPLALYFKRGIAKIELGVCKGKQDTDKREDIRRKTANREAERAVASRR